MSRVAVRFRFESCGTQRRAILGLVVIVPIVVLRGWSAIVILRRARTFALRRSRAWRWRSRVHWRRRVPGLSPFESRRFRAMVTGDRPLLAASDPTLRTVVHEVVWPTDPQHGGRWRRVDPAPGII